MLGWAESDQEPAPGLGPPLKLLGCQGQGDPELKLGSAQEEGNWVLRKKEACPYLCGCSLGSGEGTGGEARGEGRARSGKVGCSLGAVGRARRRDQVCVGPGGDCNMWSERKRARTGAVVGVQN